MEALFSPDTSVNIYQISQRHMPPLYPEGGGGLQHFPTKDKKYLTDEVTSHFCTLRMEALHTTEKSVNIYRHIVTFTLNIEAEYSLETPVMSTRRHDVTSQSCTWNMGTAPVTSANRRQTTWRHVPGRQ
jgi:hypothetical protein